MTIDAFMIIEIELKLMNNERMNEFIKNYWVIDESMNCIDLKMNEWINEWNVLENEPFSWNKSTFIEMN